MGEVREESGKEVRGRQADVEVVETEDFDGL